MAQSAVPISTRARVTILASQFNEPISRALVRGARKVLRQAGVPVSRIRVVWVPGAFELPVVAAKLAASARHPDAIIAVGALIRGQTSQYEVIAHAVAQGLSQVAVSATIPVAFGVVVAENAAQAHARAGGAMGNRGAEAALAALAVLRLFEETG